MNSIITGPVFQMLIALEEVLKKLNIDFYLVGALARDIGLSSNPDFSAQRKTEDVDIAIFLADEQQFYQVKQELIDTGDFTAHETEAIKLFYKQAIELDLMPFGDIENENRETKLGQPRLFVIDVPGFKEVFPDAEQYALNENVTLNVCPLEGIVLLKLIAQDDRPGRTKDITDIEHIISVYFELKDLEIYESHMDAMDLYDTDNVDYLRLVSSRVIGRIISQMLADSHQLKIRVLGILNRKRHGVYWQAIANGINDPTQ